MRLGASLRFNRAIKSYRWINKPLLVQKNTHGITAGDMLKLSAMYNNVNGSVGAPSWFPGRQATITGGLCAILITC